MYDLSSTELFVPSTGFRCSLPDMPTGRNKIYSVFPLIALSFKLSLRQLSYVIKNLLFVAFRSSWILMADEMNIISNEREAWIYLDRNGAVGDGLTVCGGSSAGWGDPDSVGDTCLRLELSDCSWQHCGTLQQRRHRAALFQHSPPVIMGGAGLFQSTETLPSNCQNNNKRCCISV